MSIQLDLLNTINFRHGFSKNHRINVSKQSFMCSNEFYQLVFCKSFWKSQPPVRPQTKPSCRKWPYIDPLVMSFSSKSWLWHCFYNANSTFSRKVTFSFGAIWGMFLKDFVLLQEAPRGHPGGTQKAGLPQASDDCSGTAPAQLRGSARGTNLGRSQQCKHCLGKNTDKSGCSTPETPFRPKIDQI